MSIRSSFPAIAPSLTLDFAKSKSLGPNVSFSRVTNGNIGTYTGSDGLIKYAAPDEPRFDHRVTNRTNLIRYSETFTPGWVHQRTVLTNNSIVSPDGLTNGSKIQGDGNTGGAMSVYQTYTNVQPSSSWTISVFAKAGDAKWLAIEAYDGTSNDETFFNLESGTVGTIGNNMSNPTIKSYGNGWWRCSVVRTIASNATQVRPQFTLAIGDGTISVIDTKYFYLWGAQLELGDTLTDYIATNSAAVTRTEVESVGLLLERSRKNFITTSNMSNWSIIGFTGRSLDSIGPDGVTNSAISLTEVTGTNPGQYVIYADHNVSNNNQTFTHSVFVKPVSSYNWQLNVHNIGSSGNASSFSVIFNTNTKTFTNTAGGPNSPTIEGYGYQEYSNGWFRIWAACNVGNSDQTTTSLRFHVRSLNASQSGNYTGTGALTGYVFGAEIELGNYPTAYIPTSGSQVTRPTESFIMTGDKDFSSFYNPTEWTLLVDQVVSRQMLFSGASSVYSYMFDDQAGPNQYQLRFVSDFTNPYIDTYGKTNNVTVLDAPGDYTLWTNETVDVPIRSAFTCNQTTSKFCNNGGVVKVDGSFSLSNAVSRFFISSFRTANVSKISYYPVALPSTQLQTLTTPKV